MFLANSTWEEIMRDHSRKMQEGLMAEEERLRHGVRVDGAQSEGDVEADEANDKVGVLRAGEAKPKLKVPKVVKFEETIENRERTREELENEEKLDQLIARINSQKYTMVEPSQFDEDMKALVPNLRIMAPNPHIVALQTIIRDKSVPREDFVFNADRLIRLVIEEGLNLLPFNPKIVKTPTGEDYTGVEYHRSNCGVSIVRSGEAMEKALRDCCRSIRIGKVLIQSDEETHKARVVYVKLPMDISLRKVLLLYPIMSTGNTVVKAISVLKKNGVKESNIILINLFSTPTAIRAIANRFKDLTIQTTEIHPVAPHHFGQKYFGTD